LAKSNMVTCGHCSTQNQTPIELSFGVAILARGLSKWQLSLSNVPFC
jgi:hypothetical protein